MNKLISLIIWLIELMFGKKPVPVPPDPIPVPPDPVPVPPEPEYPDFVIRLLTGHNEYRAKRGLKPLVLNKTLCKVAQLHSEWMVKHGLRHTGFPKRLRELDYSYSNCGENIAWNYKSPEDCVNAWIRSSGHRANILGNFIEVGFGYADAYWCADYASPSSSTSQDNELVTGEESVFGSSIYTK